MNKLIVPETIFRARVSRLHRLYKLNAPLHSIGEAARLIVRSFEPTPRYIQACNWMWERTPGWMKYLLSSKYRKSRREIDEIEKLIDESHIENIMKGKNIQ